MDIMKLMEELKEDGLQQESFPEEVQWDQYVKDASETAKDDKELHRLLAVRDQAAKIEGTSLLEVLKMTFNQAKTDIEQMTLPKRIDMLQEVDAYKEFLYNMANQYGEKGIGREDQLTAKEFRGIIGKIKHVEILQNWLFGIN